MTPDRLSDEALIESLADGAAIDWASLEAEAATSDQRRRYRNLRLVARVAELHRTIVLDEEIPASTIGRSEGLRDPEAWGHLSIQGRVAAGAFGQVYRAHDPQLRRDVALKLLRGDISAFRPIDRLLTEARTLARIQHPNVVTVYGADVRDGLPGLWMELVDGQTLGNWIRTNGAMGAGEAAAVGVDLCRALAAVHGAGLVHGDVKAQNVMRENGGRIVLMDFGAGRPQGADPAGVAGTPMYLAPEVLAGEPPTPQSDIYSVGVLLFYLLTAAYPYTAADLDGLTAAHADGNRVWLRDLRPDLPDGLVQTTERALDPDPARRFATAGQMERAFHPVPAPASVEDPSARATTGRARSTTFAFAAGAVALLCLVVGLIVWSRAAAANRGTMLTGIRTIGVLPMSDLTGSLVPAHFARGLTDDLISTIGEVTGLTVKSGLFSRGRTQSPIEVARALDVDAVLETSLSAGQQDSGNTGRLTVRARLIAAGTQGIVWSQEFNRQRGDSLALSRDVARALSRAVNIRLSPTESARLMSVAQTHPAAEEAYLLGRTHLDQYGGGNANLALQAFERALRFDPQHAAAHAGAARAHVALGLNGSISHSAARAAAAAELRRALDLDPDLAEAHATLAHMSYIYDWDWAGAERAFLHSLELNPNSPYARTFYAEFLAARRRFDESISQAETARQLDPESCAAARRYALVLYYKHDFASAARALQDASAIEPNNAAAPILQGRIAEAQRAYDDALASTRQALQLSGGGGVPLQVQEIRQQALAGHPDDALARLRSLQRTPPAGAIHVSARDLAYVELALGNTDKALDLFRHSVADRDPTVVWFAVDPRLDALQRDPRFQELLRTVGLPYKF
jgi:eukaryotic-like serine/threonine-protein kinase